MSFNRIFVLGAGAIGSSYGALLSKENEVTLVGKKAHVDAINSESLTLSGDVEDRFIIQSETKIKEIPENTLILLTTKAHDSAKTIGEIKGLLKNDTVILILQNGLGNKALVKDIVGEKISVTRGLAKIAAEFLEPGRITFWNGETILEPTEIGKRIAVLFDRSGLKARVSNDMDKEVWNKLIVNCVVNPLSAVLQVKDNEIVVDSLRRLRYGIVEECVEVGKSEGIAFQTNLEKSIDRDISKFSNLSSMAQDIVKENKTEIDFLNGKIVELGRKNNIPTPFNEAMVCLIKFLEKKR